MQCRAGFLRDHVLTIKALAVLSKRGPNKQKAPCGAENARCNTLTWTACPKGKVSLLGAFFGGGFLGASGAAFGRGLRDSGRSLSSEVP